MYHDVAGADLEPSGFQGDGPDVYRVAMEAFVEQLDRIDRATDRPPLRGAELRHASEDAWLLTFDDGGGSATVAGEELARRSWPAHFFVVTDLIGHPGFLSSDEIRALAELGHVVGSHSRSHPDRMADLSEDELLGEWSDSRAALSETLGSDVTTASVPGGLYSRAVGRAAARAGYTELFTSLPSRRVRSLDGCLVIGRYAVRRGTTAAEAAAAAAGEPKVWARQAVPWALRGAVKAVAGRRYTWLRRTALKVARSAR